MNQRCVRTALVVLLLAAGASPALAQAIQNVVLRNSFNPLGAGARGLGMGGAFIAVADDGTAASFNPAGLAQLRRTELTVVGFQRDVEATINLSGRDPFSESTLNTALDFAGLSIPFEVGARTLTVQLSYRRSIDMVGRGVAVFTESILSDDPGPGIPPFADVVADIRPEQEGAFHTASFAVAYEVTDRLLLGATVNYWIAEWLAQGQFDLSFSAPAEGSAVPQEYFRSEVQFRQDQSMRGLNLDLGFLLRYPKLSIGGVFRTPFVGNYDLRETTLTQELVFGIPQHEEPISRGSDVTTRLRWPHSAGIGIALRPITGLTIAADYSRANWSRAAIEDMPADALLVDRPEDDAGDPAADSYTTLNFFDLQPVADTVIQNTDQWRVGAEYLLALPRVVIPFRGGWFRDQSPIPNLTADLEGKKLTGWTAGTGLNFSRVALDVAFERRESDAIIGLSVRGEEFVVPENPATETVTENKVVASLMYRFGGDDDPFKRLFRTIFSGGE